MIISKVLQYTAMATVLASPAFAQDASLGSILNPQLLLGTNSQTGVLYATATAVGVTATTVTSQFNSNNLNQVGGTLQTGSAATPLVSGDLSLGIGQTVGAIPSTGLTDTSKFTQSTTNSISASGIGTSGYLANVLAGGNQNAVSGVNTAALGMQNGSALTLQQAQNGTPAAASSQTSTNAISAFSVTGNTAVNGYGGAQNAQTVLNAGLLAIGAGATSAGSASVALDQVQKGLGAAATSTNSALAGVNYGTSPVIDPSVSNLNQKAGISLNTFQATGGNLALANGPDGVNATTGLPVGGQNLSLANGAYNLSNNALATTGVSSSGLGTVAGATTGVGSTAISGVTQNASLNVNSAGNTGGNLSLGNTVSPFTQNVAGAYVAPIGATLVSAVLNTSLTASTPTTNVANSALAQTGSGNAAISGSTTSASQYGAQNLNTISSTGVLSGALSQTAGGATLVSSTISPYSTAAYTGAGITGASLTNSAIAATQYGGASVTNMGQVQNNTINAVNGAAGVGLTMQQLAVGATGVLTAGGNNVQLASTAGGASTISNGQQALNAGVNVASIGGVLQGSAQQIAKDITTTNTNTLGAAGGAAVVTGSQVSVSGVNVIK